MSDINITDICRMSLTDVGTLLKEKKLSAYELTEAYIDQTVRLDPDIEAYVTYCFESARECAKAADGIIASGEGYSPLTGIPYALKDNVCTRGIRTTCASRMLENFVPPYSATVHEILQGYLAPLIGKANMDEFSMGASTENSALKKTVNPLDPSRVPGGSSGGCAAAVMSGEAAFAIGSDTGGSVRQPACLCGAVGIKPTYGAVSRYGLIAFASSLDQIGPITRCVRDNALVLFEISKKDARDSTSVGLSKDITSDIEKGVSGMHIAIPRELTDVKVSSDVSDAVMTAARTLEGLGASVDIISVPELSDSVNAYYIISAAEASSNLARYDGIRYGKRAEDCESIEELYRQSRSRYFGDEVKRRIILGTFVLSRGYLEEYYKKALNVKARLSERMSSLYRSYDAVLSPVFPTVARRFGEMPKDPADVYAEDIFTVAANLTGAPAIALPGAYDKDGMPVGIQLMGKHFSEETLYRVAYAIEASIRRAK